MFVFTEVVVLVAGTTVVVANCWVVDSDLSASEPPPQAAIVSVAKHNDE